MKILNNLKQNKKLTILTSDQCSLAARISLRLLKVTKGSGKKGNRTKRETYRPLSLLSVPGKLLEGVISVGLDEHAIIEVPNPNQWGFKKGHSTELLLIYLTETWKKAIEEGKAVGVIFIDFSKAFDTVDHEILRLKLQSSGISGKVATWIEDYLSNRKKLTVIETESSEVLDVSMGVPQGSLLGPRLFTAYTNDLPKAVKSGQVEMYADDTTAFSIGENIDDVCIKLQETLNEINDWCTNIS